MRAVTNWHFARPGHAIGDERGLARLEAQIIELHNIIKFLQAPGRARISRSAGLA